MPHVPGSEVAMSRLAPNSRQRDALWTLRVAWAERPPRSATASAQPEAGRLLREHGAGAQYGKPVGPVGSEILVNPTVAMKPNELTSKFHCNDLRVRRPGVPTPSPELLRIFSLGRLEYSGRR